MSEYNEFIFPDPVAPWERGFAAALNAISFIALCILLPILWKRRSHRMISPRSFISLTCFQLAMFVWQTITTVSFFVGKPQFCEILGATYTVLPFFSLHFMLLIPTLVLQFDLNKMKVDYQLGHENKTIWKSRKFISPQAKFFYQCCAGLVQIAIYIALRMTTNIPGDCLRTSLIVMAAHLIVFFLVLGYFLIRLTKVKDPFFMRFENDFGSAIMIPATLLMFIYPFGPGVFPAWFDFRWVNVYTAMSGIFSNLLFPVLLTNESFRLRLEQFQNGAIEKKDQADLLEKGNVFASRNGLDMFKAVLANEILAEAFTQFTVRDWSVENLLFYRAVEKYQLQFDQTLAKNTAKDIIAEFINYGAPLEINLPVQVSREIQKRFNEGDISIDLFDNAQRHIFDIMQNDTFVKWIRTQEYKEALEAVTSSRANSGNSGSSMHNKPSREHSNVRASKKSTEEIEFHIVDM